jgi:hypothetical protein
MTVTGEETLLNILIENSKLKVIYDVPFELESPDAVALHLWQYIVVSSNLNSVDNETTIRLSISPNYTVAEATFAGALMDDPNARHILGAEADITTEGAYIMANHLAAFYWQVCINATYLSEADMTARVTLDACGTNQCTICPVNECLSNCEIDEFYN